uniref:BTB domain-containing protein n=1 Tax=Caenorhabditis tropicalis TaxID=1561998 RepID=A0A1I7TCJ7_9PELO
MDDPTSRKRRGGHEKKEPALKKLRDFSQASGLHDVILNIGGEKFYVSKIHLAQHSEVLQNLFFGNFKEKNQKEIELKEVDAGNFQKFLEVINGELSINDDTLEGILIVADFLRAPTAINRCRHYLIEHNTMSIRDKMRLAEKFHFQDVKKKIIGGVQSSQELISILPYELNDLDKTTTVLLLRKALDLLARYPETYTTTHNNWVFSPTRN